MTVKLTEAECEHLLHLLEHSLYEGSYYGQQEHYRKRAQRLVIKLGGLSK